MKRTPEQAEEARKQARALHALGWKVPDACRAIGISSDTYYGRVRQRVSKRKTSPETEPTAEQKAFIAARMSEKWTEHRIAWHVGGPSNLTRWIRAGHVPAPPNREGWPEITHPSSALQDMLYRHSAGSYTECTPFDRAVLRKFKASAAS